METTCNKSYNYKEITLFSFSEFKKRCKIFFDMYFGKEKFTFISITHYYCGEGSHFWTIYDKDFNELYTIEQHDYACNLYFSVYCGDTTFTDYTKEKEHHFQSLTSAFNYIISII